ncbi:hypothetical protein [Desertibaculum subflavum]|uniref:hypothetical protein n=1 Tax=Desertibaculum subflavum TaxID=2268458 RepID=UPI000E66450D
MPMHRIVAAGAALLAAGGASAAEIDFSGEYVMRGRGFAANDSAYQGTCSLQRQADIYQVSCYNQDTRHTYTGKGLATGDTLAIFIGDLLKGDHNRSFAGEYLVVYRRQPDGSLAGTWVHSESESAGAETLTPRR